MISIIMPLYNSGTTVLESINSIRAQTFPDWELLVADDGSTDDGPAQVLAAAAEDPRIVMLPGEAMKSQGPSAARNRAASRAHGEYLAFLDADDLWLPRKLESQLEVMERNPVVGMIWGPAEYFYPDRSYVQPTGITDSGFWEPPALVGLFLRSLRATPCPSGLLIRRKTFEAIRGFDENLRRGEDIAFCMKAAFNCVGYYDASVLFRYRRHAESSTSRSNLQGQRQKEDLLFHQWALTFVRENRGLLQFERRAEDNYHAALHAAAAGTGWWDSRRQVFRGLGVFPGLPAKRRWRLLLDCFLPFKLSRRLAKRISGRLER